MNLLVKYLTDHCSIEKSDDLSSDVSFSAFLMSEDSLGGGENEMAELSGWQNVISPLLEIRE